MAFERNYVAYSKHAPWGGGVGDGEIVVYGVDWSAAAFAWAFGPAEGSAASFTLSAAAAGSQGVSATYDSTAQHPVSGAEVGATTLVPQIDEATLEGLTYSGADPLLLRHDLLVTPSGEPQRPLCYGTFTINQGIAD